ncbi:MAG: mannose-6-phosphate isomerase-like protein (cupin superfamily) [Planctomycetota bacterium]|jgi:mannose-6-phosphate isomerase-like protein (cupin superfamily)
MHKINIQEKLDLFNETWTPKIIGELNGQQIKLAKLEGEFVWHSHEYEDEMFMVIEGELLMQLRDREVLLKAGEMFIVPRGVEHNPVAHKPCSLMLFEPAATAHTGDVDHERTVRDQKWI